MKVILPRDVRKIDRRAEEEYLIPTLILMEHAAGAITDSAIKTPGNILVVCGTGGNGGDGFAAARLLHQMNRDVDILFPFSDESLSGDIKLNHDIAKKHGILIYPDINHVDIGKYGLIIDCLFGTGLSRDIQGNLANIIDLINKSDAYKISADIPSGINGATGCVMGRAVRADQTITFACEKPGLLLFPGRDHAGQVIVANIGIPEKLLETSDMHHYTRNEIARMLPKRPRNSHKGSYGHVLILAGSRGFMGAGGLCSRGAVLGGAGLVTWAYPAGERANPPLEAMTCQLPATNGKIDADAAREILRGIIENKTCIAMGPGLGVDAAYELLKILIEYRMPMVLDADAISALALFDDLPCFSNQCIITPHPGEMARVLHKDTGYIIDNPVQCARELAAKTNTVVILKMATSIIAAADGKTCFNTTGNPGMAAGGSGDVLAGLCAALLARGCDAYTAAACSAHIHGLAGDLAAQKYGEDSMGSSDIANYVAESYASLLK